MKFATESGSDWHQVSRLPCLNDRVHQVGTVFVRPFRIREVLVVERAYCVLFDSKLIISCLDFFVELGNPSALSACEFLLSQLEEDIGDCSS